MAKTHILILDAIRDDVAALIAGHAPGVSFTISPQEGILLQGVAPDETSAETIVQLVRDNIGDAGIVRSEIKTATGLLREVAELSKRAQISQFVQFHLNDGMVEAEGALSLAQLDAWAGFLQAYSSQFSKLIPLRSFVSLQDTDGSAAITAGVAFYLGSDELQGGNQINLQRLREGTYTAADLLVGGDKATPDVGKNAIANIRPSVPILSAIRAPQKRIDLIKLLNPESPGGKAAPQTGSADLDALAERAIRLWETGKLRALEDGVVLSEAIDGLKVTNIVGSATPADYKKLLQSNSRMPQRVCWGGSAVSFRNVTGVLFWLDVLSRSSTLTLTAFDDASSAILVEAAFNPMQTANCAHLASDGSLNSYYLESVSKEPHRVRGLLRDILVAPVEITGLSLPGMRYFQTSDGQIFREGAVLNANMSVQSIGELGVMFSTASGIAVAFVTGELAWQTD